MNTQTFAQAQTVTDEELMAATGGFLGALAGRIGSAVAKKGATEIMTKGLTAAAPGVLIEGMKYAGSHEA